MIRHITLSALAALALSAGAAAAAEEGHVTDYDFSFEGPFGSYDSLQLQRGLKIYTQVCSACHGLKYVPIRTLTAENGPEMPEDQVRAYASRWQVWNKETRERVTAKPADNFPEGNDANAPDLSLMAKARAGFEGPHGLGINQLLHGIGGPEYIATLLQSYTGETKTQAGSTLYENAVFPGGWIQMPPPLHGEDVEYDDGDANDIESEARDVAAFLMWTAEPKLTARKEAGFTGVLFLAILAGLLYMTNRRIWAPHKEGRRKP